MGVYMLALFYREFCESPVKLLHREFLFVEFFGSFFPKQDMMFNSILTVKGVIGFCAVATQGIIVLNLSSALATSSVTNMTVFSPSWRG